jgi:methylenetetrahydrofolate reductase (NADPH)
LKVTEHLQGAQRTLISFEILPPLKGKSIGSLYRILDELMVFKPPFINVTYHRAEYQFKQLSNGLFERVYTRKRPGTVGICAAIAFKYGIDAVPHLVCGGFSRAETEDALLDLNYLGINNVLLLRGDAAAGEPTFRPETNGNSNALELVSQAVDMNNGKYLERDLQDAIQTDFCIGVAGYPEKHFESPNELADLRYLKQKVDAGADYIVTQMFFDNKRYFDFVAKCREIGINVPIIPGIKPITNMQQISRIPGLFHVHIPDDLNRALEAAKNKEAVRQVGIEWATAQSRELIAAGVPCVHFYTMSTVEPFKEIMKFIL